MLNHGPPDAERHEQEARLRQFLAWLIPIVLGFVPLLGIAFVAFGLISLAIAGALLLIYAILLLYVRAKLQPNRLDAAVAAICSGLFVLVLLLKLTEPLSPATLAVMPLLAVAIALPYVGARMLRRLLIVAWLMALIVALLNEIAAPVARLPLWVSGAFRAGSFAVVVGLLLLLLWQFSRRLAATLERSHAANTALRQAEIKYRTLVEQVPAVTYTGSIELTDAPTYVSPQIETLLGFTPQEWLAQPQIWERQIHPEDQARVLAANRHSRATGEPLDIEYRILTRDGRTIWLHDRSVWIRDDAGNIHSYQGVAFDITERKRAEEADQLFERRLLETQKLESLAVLAGGIAHDFNNILAIILGNVDLARIELPPDSSVHELLAPVASAVQRASNLTQQMLAYSGKGHFLLEQIDLNLLLRQLHEPIRATLGTHAQVIYDLAPDLPPITADPSQIRQAVLNLAINAAEAIGDTAGAMTIRTDARLFERADLADSYLAPDLAAGRYVVLEVADSGAGMDEATLARIFEPFFTTKFMGRGLGLAAVLGIVRGHHGAIRMRSAPGQGSTFTILLPAAEA